MKQGQILILVLLAVVVVLAIGLSVASRNITNLRTSTQTEQSQRAFTAAEGGVEDVLSNLTEIGEDIVAGTNFSGCQPISFDTAECNVTVGGLEAKVEVKSSGVYEQTVTTDKVAQIDLDGLSSGEVKVEWASKDEDSEVDANGPASVEISIVYGDNVSGYNVQRWFFQGSSARTSNETVLVGSNPAGADTCVASTEFELCAKVDLSSFTSPRILRIRPFWVQTTVRVAGDGITLPLQKYEVSSTATTEIGVTRKVQVSRSALPQVPAVFDYAIYSETDIIK